MFSSYGKIIYNPSSHIGTANLWAILSCDEEIGKYYRSWYQREYQALNHPFHCRLGKPALGAHISFIRNEHIKSFPRANQIVEFSYEHNLQHSETHLWLPVRCDILLDLREQLGLPRQPRAPLHLTVGVKNDL
jgi:hypothetical protein